MSSQHKNKWGKQHDERLKNLLKKGRGKGGITAKDLTRGYIKKVFKNTLKIEKMLVKKTLDNFVRIYRNKICAYKLGESINNARSECFETMLLYL